MDNEFDIAIVGMSCRFPGAGNVEQFWRNLAGGVESITRLSDEEILRAGVPAHYLSDPHYVKAAPVLEEPGHFDAGFFGYSPMEARTMDPQQRILLELAYEALEDAGCNATRHQERIGVFTGSAMNTYFMNAGLNGRFSEEYIPTLIGNDKDFLSTRISYKLNLKGPSITVQTACSTSLVAIHLARQSLLSQESDMALAGAISVRVPHRAGYFYDGGGVVSPDGHVRAFDAKANGTVFGSGGGVVLLKRLADALSDGDTIHAVIRGSAVNNDGSEKAGYTAPSVNSQADAVVEALTNAGVEADTISYVEAHGSGTPVGDPIEVMALTKAFRTSTQRSGYCAIGSAKTNVGHLDAAAGIVGVIKTVLSLKHRQLPPSLNFHEANPEINFPATPFYVNTKLRDWISDGPRRAGVMATGMGGTNAHVVLEEPPAPAEMASAKPPHLLILSAKTETALDLATRRLQDYLAGNERVNMSDVAHTLRIGRKALPHRRCLVCADRNDAIAALGQADSNRVVSGEADEARRPVILLLPGIGDHYVGMAYDLYDKWPVFRQEVDRCSRILEPHLGVDMRNIIYPKGQSWKKPGKSKGIDLKKMLGRNADVAQDEEAAELNQTLFAQPALFTIEYATARLWQSLGITFDAIVGHSMGEYVAACLAGVLSLEDALRLIAARAKLVNQLPQGAMLAVTLAEKELLPLLPSDLSISLINGPRLCVIAGPISAVRDFEKMLDSKGIICRRVQNAHAFHSKMLTPIVKAFEEEVSKVRLSEPTIPYISNVTGTWIARSEATNPAYWAMHAIRTARFSDALSELWQNEDPILLEAGPGRTLCVLAMQHPDRSRAASAVAISSIRHDYEIAPDDDFMLQGIGKLWLAGVNIDWENFRADEKRRRLPLPTYPFERQYYWMTASSEHSGKPRKYDAPPQDSVLDDWFYVPAWKRTPFPSEVHKDSKAEGICWLIIGNQQGGGASIKAELDRRGLAAEFIRFGEQFTQCSDGSFELNPAGIDDYLKLFRQLQGRLTGPVNIVHLGGLTGTQPRTTHSARGISQDFGFYSLLYIAQAIGELNLSGPIKIGIISNRIHEVTGEEVLDPEMAAVLGPCGVIPKEFPNVTCFNIDLPDTQPIDDLPKETLAKIISEFSGTHRGQVIAYRGRYRWEKGYEQVRLARPAQSDVTNEASEIRRLRRGGVYLITGGTGGLGLVIAKYLAMTCQPKIVLTKKNAFPAKSTWRALVTAAETPTLVRRTVKRLLEIEELGADVEVLAADASDRSQMQRVFDEVIAKFGTIHGAIHAAGIVKAGLIQAKTREAADRVLAPKVNGTMILFELLKDTNPDFLILFSSVTSLLTPYAEVDYSAANAYLDAFGCFANAERSFRTITINWPGWKEVGQLADLESLPGVEGWKEAALKKAITTRDGLEAFKRVLNSDLKQVVVSPEDLGRLLEESHSSFNPAEYLSHIKSDKETQAGQKGPRKAVDQPTSRVEAELAEIWRNVLGFEQIGINENFFELGGHSLLAIQVASRVRQALSVEVSLRELFAAPTISGLAARIEALRAEFRPAGRTGDRERIRL
jgi:acyl transferase domain-containing protein/acyl carrier protein